MSKAVLVMEKGRTVKEEALANAARNKSSDQVCLVPPSNKGEGKPADKDEQSMGENERESVNVQYGSYNMKQHNMDILLALMDRNLKHSEERVRQRMHVLVKEMMKNVTEMVQDEEAYKM